MIAPVLLGYAARQKRAGRPDRLVSWKKYFHGRLLGPLDRPSMILRRCGDGVLVRAPAKVNLFLEVLHRRPDGYHELASLITAVSLYDTLLFGDDPSGTVRLRCDRPELSVGPDNLICRAAELLRRRTGRDLGTDVRLWKRIPTQAGLGGGSSDAAAALAGLNALWRLGLKKAELATLG